MNLTPFQVSKLVEWAEHVLTNGSDSPMPRGIQEVDMWAANAVFYAVPPFPKFDTEHPYTWEG